MSYMINNLCSIQDLDFLEIKYNFEMIRQVCQNFLPLKIFASYTVLAMYYRYHIHLYNV